MFQGKRLVALSCLCIALGCSAISCTSESNGQESQPTLSLAPCNENVKHQKNLAAIDALCGTYDVWEDRVAQKGRKIQLNVAVIPALASTPEPDPLFILTGGPGTAATESWRLNGLPWGKKIHTTRDIILVDQRGTGASNPLECLPDGGTPFEERFELESNKNKRMELIEKCANGYDADVHLYKTSIAMDDLDEVRRALGYEKINIWGGSYGTRAALVYMRRHGDTLRSVVLEAIAPMGMRFLNNASDGDRAFSLLASECKENPACNSTYPNLEGKLRTLLTSLEETPAKTQVVHPRTGALKEITIEVGALRGILFFALYDSVTSSIIPYAIEQATKGDFSIFATLLEASTELENYISVGMQVAVICNEDLAHTPPEGSDAGVEPGIFSNKEMLSDIEKTCRFFGGASVPASFFEPVVSNVPTLIISGELDPITPPRWGESAAKNLSNSKHIVAPGTGHGASHHKCVSKMIVNFITNASFSKIETACLQNMRRFPFFLGPLGPISTTAEETAK